jgi:hypothetical protein
MQTPNLPAIGALRPAWNKGRIVGQKLPLKPKHVWAIHVRSAKQNPKTGSVWDFEGHTGIGREVDGRSADRRARNSPAGAFYERLHISTRQYARIVRDWVSSIGLQVAANGTDSVRRTKVTQILKKTGNLRAVQLLLGHTKTDSTVRYIGVEL